MNNTNETRIILCNGKYTVVHSNGKNLRALRNGEEWRSLVGDGLILAMAQEIESLIEQQHNLEKKLNLLATDIKDLANQAGINSNVDPFELMKSIQGHYKDKDLALEAKIGTQKIASNISNEIQAQRFSSEQEWEVNICRQGIGFNSVTVKAASYDQAIEAADEMSGNIQFTEKDANYTYSATPKNVIAAKPNKIKL